MCRYRMLAAALAAAALSACTQEGEPALTQWGTPCSEYDVSAKDCHAVYASYGQYMAAQFKADGAILNGQPK